MKIQRTILTPTDHVLAAIEDHGRKKFPKVEISRAGNTVVFFRKSMWQKQQATFTVDGHVLTAEGDVMDAQKWIHYTLAKVDEHLDDHGWKEAAELHGTKTTKDDLIARGRFIEELGDNERIEIAVTGLSMKHRIVLAATNHRVIMINDSALGLKTNTQSIGLDKISAVRGGSGALSGMVEIMTSNEKIKVESIVRQESEEFTKVLTGLLSKPQSAAPVDLGSGVGSLEKLAELHAQGILTDEEFSAAKAKALGL